METVRNIVNAQYPIGKIYMTTDPRSPNIYIPLLSGTVWEIYCVDALLWGISNTDVYDNEIHGSNDSVGYHYHPYKSNHTVNTGSSLGSVSLSHTHNATHTHTETAYHRHKISYGFSVAAAPDGMADQLGRPDISSGYEGFGLYSTGLSSKSSLTSTTVQAVTNTAPLSGSSRTYTLNLAGANHQASGYTDMTTNVTATSVADPEGNLPLSTPCYIWVRTA